AWWKGDVHSLLVSILFGWVLVIAWLATFVWPEWLSTFFSPTWLSSLLLSGTWISLGVAALIAAVRPSICDVSSRSRTIPERQKNLELAQEFYLQANYFEAEKLVRKNVSRGNDDVESTLLWISILRRTRRISQALELISSTDRLDAALPWMPELRSEKEQCLRLKIQTPPAHD
ncbi:MAG: hypothetical protein K9M08_17730, partial [Pirellula sp.]|nr:hypothetical protein [Pirellula sp.]